MVLLLVAYRQRTCQIRFWSGYPHESVYVYAYWRILIGTQYLQKYVFEFQVLTQQPPKGGTNYITMQIEEASKTSYREINKQRKQANI